MGITFIDADYFINQTNLNTLILDHNYELNVINQTDMFIMHGSISYIKCRFCGLIEIQNETFAGLPNLEKLLLNSNRISYVAPNAFWNNEKLQILDLESNRLVHLNEIGRLNYLNNLKGIYLSFNENFRFMKGSAILSTENNLSFESNSCGIDQIYSETFSQLPNLLNLDLSNNTVHHLATDIFNSNRRLKTFDLSWNPVGNQIFQFNLTNLITLVCNNCNVSEINRESLKRMPEIKYLMLNRNNIRVVPMNTFDKNSIIEIIEMNSNQLNTFPAKAVNRMSESLTRLCIDFNPFIPSYDHTLFKNAYKLQSLRNECLNENKRATEWLFEDDSLDIKIPGGVLYNHEANQPNITIELNQTVNLTGLNLVYIQPDYFNVNKLKRMRRLQMSMNRKFNFNAGEPFLRHKSISIFTCNFCGITELYPETFAQMPKLQSIEIKDNYLTRLSGETFNFPNQIQSLNFESNQIASLHSDTLDHLPSILHLHLSHNANFQIRQKRQFLYSETLSVFSCHNCNIQQLDDEMICKLPSLNELDLRSNVISSVNGKFAMNQRLKKILLDFNRINTFDENLYCEFYFRGTIIGLKGNKVLRVPKCKFDEEEKVKVSRFTNEIYWYSSGSISSNGNWTNILVICIIVSLIRYLNFKEKFLVKFVNRDNEQSFSKTASQTKLLKQSTKDILDINEAPIQPSQNKILRETANDCRYVNITIWNMLKYKMFKCFNM